MKFQTRVRTLAFAALLSVTCFAGVANAGIAGSTSVWGEIVNYIAIARGMDTFPKYAGKHDRFIALASETREARFLKRVRSGDRAGARLVLKRVLGY